MGMMMAFSDLLFFLPRAKRGLPAMALTISVMAAAATIAVAVLL
jgi:hypothetical protein